MRPPIYEPKGKAKEYGDLALNIYTGCPHRCYYCFAPSVLHKDKETFHSHVEPRPGIVEETKKQVEREKITGKLIHMCFTCDPYPTGCDTSVTREIIALLKYYGNHVQILTKGNGSRDFDLLDENDWYGITYDGIEEEYAPLKGKYPADMRLIDIYTANQSLIKTWCSFEPVIHPGKVLECLNSFYFLFDKVKIGKLNYHKSDVNWKEFGQKAEAICIEKGLDYYIKDSLRAEMERG